MPNPYVVKFWPETWDSKPFYWHFYEREEVEQSTYDKGNQPMNRGNVLQIFNVFDLFLQHMKITMRIFEQETLFFIRQ